jgi:hypothetical protein
MYVVCMCVCVRVCVCVCMLCVFCVCVCVLCVCVCVASSGRRVVPRRQTDGRTDKHDETNSRFSQFYERAQNHVRKCPSNVNILEYLLFSYSH